MNMKRQHIRIIAFLMALILTLEPTLGESSKAATRVNPAPVVNRTRETETSGVEEEATASPEEKSASETDNTNYVTDLRLYKAGNNKSDRTAAIKRAKNEGYKLVGGYDNPMDLNSGTGKAYIFLGYKTGNNVKKAVRGMKMLEMDLGYQWFDYQTIAEGQMEKLEPLASDLMIVGKEFKENLKAGSKSADYAKK